MANFNLQVPFLTGYIRLVARNQAASLTLVTSQKTFLSVQIRIVYCTQLPLAETKREHLGALLDSCRTLSRLDLDGGC